MVYTEFPSKIFPLKNKWIQEDAVLFCGMYYDGSVAIRAVAADDHDPICTVTVCIGNDFVNNWNKDEYICIKNWSENEGVLQCMIDNGFVEYAGNDIPINWVKANVCKMLPPLLEIVKKAKESGY
jgi:hypothetical protein